jgi:hypothetical protein
MGNSRSEVRIERPVHLIDRAAVLHCDGVQVKGWLVCVRLITCEQVTAFLELGTEQGLVPTNDRSLSGLPRRMRCVGVRGAAPGQFR